MVNYLLYRIGQFIACHLPLKLAYGLAVSFSDLHYIFADKDKARVKANLKAIFPQMPEKEIHKIRIRTFRNFAKYLVDFFRFANIDQEYIKKNIQVENRDYFDEVLAQGKGGIVMTAHIGNWELGGVVIALLNYPFWVVALPHKNKNVDKFFNHQRESKGVKVIPLGRAAGQCMKVLKNNEFVALVGDRDFTKNGVVLDFFGKPTVFPMGPAFFALKTGASILPGFMIRNENDSFTLKMERPIKPVVTGNRDADIKALATQYKNIVENYIRKYPDQWYMFMKFWIEE